MKITKLKINKFHNLNNIEISFSSNLNAIAGQNGTSKTSILGLISHIFTFDEKENNLLGRAFTTKFSEIFRFAYPDYDKPGGHIWNLEFDDGKTISAISHDRKESGKKETIRIRVGKSAKGSGKIYFPVIYLGMARLFPLSVEDEKLIKSSDSLLTKDEIKEFQDLHNEILLMDEKIITEHITSSTKEFHAPSTLEYNHLGNSAGQDNIGQIISALLSFKRLRKKLGEDYKGGILLIDELDASLYPAAQMKLIEKLYKKSLELNLQIFFTTHSLEVLEQTRKYNNSKIIFLDKSHGPVEPRYDLDPKELSQKLLVLGPDALRKIFHEKYVYCEDKEAVDFLKNLLDIELKKNLNIFSTSLGDTVLKEIAKKKIPDFKNATIVLDGDSNKSIIKNVLYLPGEVGPDALIFDLLKKLPPEDEFWKNTKGYDKQFCFKDIMSLDSTIDEKRKRVKVKEWYKAQQEYWGRLNNRVWKLWISKNPEESKKFVEKFKKTIKI